MQSIVRVGLAQINLTVGDLKSNAKKIIDGIKKAQKAKADIICFPELAITGYPPEDLLLRPKFIEDNLAALGQVVKNTGGIIAVVGFANYRDGCLYNSAAIINDGKISEVYAKNCLPNYGVFDEKRYFTTGRGTALLNVKNVPVGVTICEDIWAAEGPAERIARKGGRLLININASPFHKGKSLEREERISKKAWDNSLTIVYNNLVGAQDELVFDGSSFIVNENGALVAIMPPFKEKIAFFDLKFDNVAEVPSAFKLPPPREDIEFEPETSPPVSEEAEVYSALKLGLRDYIVKNGFEKVVVGLSGGIDSSLTAVIAADALVADNVLAVLMPSRYTSKESVSGAQKVTESLGIKMLSIPIDPIFKAYLSSLKEKFAGTKEGVAEQNIQARIRGNLLMALSNKFGYITLATGNKSELSIGYATLYGDMAGGFAVLKDVYKTQVYELAKYRNKIKQVIPDFIIKRPPSAELLPGQLDTDVLPPYEVLDPVLQAYVEEDRSPEDIISDGFDEKTVTRVVAMVDNNEYKRRQAAPGIKITPKAFGKDRRMPITNRYRS